MRTVAVTDVLVAGTPKKLSTFSTEAIVGRTLGEVSIEELMLAVHAVKGYSGLEEAAAPLREIYMESEEE